MCDGGGVERSGFRSEAAEATQTNIARRNRSNNSLRVLSIYRREDENTCLGLGQGEDTGSVHCFEKITNLRGKETVNQVWSVECVLG